MSKKEREICKFKIDLMNLFVCPPSNAPINVKPQGGGRPGVGGGFDITSLPVAGTFDHSSSPGGRDF